MICHGRQGRKPGGLPVIDHGSQSPDQDARRDAAAGDPGSRRPEGGRGEGAKGTPEKPKIDDRPPKQSGYMAEFPHLSGFLPSLF